MRALNMKNRTIAGLSVASIVLIALSAASMAANEQGETLKTPAEFSDIADDVDRGSALFGEMAKVITHPRCMNCHPRDDIPRQGDNMALHQPPVERYNAAGLGAPGMRCGTCHGSENADLVGVGGLESLPGHVPWQLAPASMGWIGLSVGEICEQIKDPERNGGKSLEELLEHNAEDGLVGWGWHPGDGRQPVPGTQAQFGDLTKAWIDSGAHCPAS